MNCYFQNTIFKFCKDIGQRVGDCRESFYWIPIKDEKFPCDYLTYDLLTRLINFDDYQAAVFQVVFLFSYNKKSCSCVGRRKMIY